MHPRPSHILAKLLIAAAAVLPLLLGSMQSTFSSFNAVTHNPSGTMSAGTVAVGDNDSGSALLSLSAGKPGDVVTGCIVVTYTGTVPATVVLHGTTAGTGLDQYIELKVTRGTIPGTPAAGSCANFTADTTNYIGQGSGVIFSGTLQSWPDTSAAGLADPRASSVATWTRDESHAYRFQATLGASAAAQGKTATQSFTWEATNS